METRALSPSKISSSSRLRRITSKNGTCTHPSRNNTSCGDDVDRFRPCLWNKWMDQDKVLQSPCQVLVISEGRKKLGFHQIHLLLLRLGRSSTLCITPNLVDRPQFPVRRIRVEHFLLPSILQFVVLLRIELSPRLAQTRKEEKASSKNADLKVISTTFRKQP